MELDGQTAIVTGAGRGIGRAIALELASMGAAITVAESNRETGERTAGEVRALGRPALALWTDVTQRADLETMAKRTVDEFGRADILVNNAGIYRAARPLEVTEEIWENVMDINAKAVFFASQAVLPHMLAAKRGNIISLASMAGKMGGSICQPALLRAINGVGGNHHASSDHGPRLHPHQHQGAGPEPGRPTQALPGLHSQSTRLAPGRQVHRPDVRTPR
jgi:NAD(P)-dependent dehydrogenase (short-subunit alcohol dehydrogenase family)